MEALKLEQNESKPTQTFVKKQLEYNTSVIRNYLLGRTQSPGSKYKNINESLWFIRKGKHNTHKGICAKKINGLIIGNSSDISAYKRGSYFRPTQLSIQKELAEHIPMIPFSVFEDADLDLNSLEIIEKGPDEILHFGRIELKTGEKIYEHYTGGLLFRIVDHYYLFDIDRNELKRKNFNAWMSELNRPCSSIADAYKSLKPKEISELERFLGKEVSRQGEWFFVPVKGKFKQDGKKEAVLQAKGNRAHTVSEISPEGYVRGRVNHAARDHKELFLKDWHKPIPNTAVGSFKISGMVD